MAGARCAAYCLQLVQVPIFTIDANLALKLQPQLDQEPCRALIAVLCYAKNPRQAQLKKSLIQDGLSSLQRVTLTPVLLQKSKLDVWCRERVTAVFLGNQIQTKAVLGVSRHQLLTDLLFGIGKRPHLPVADIGCPSGFIDQSAVKSRIRRRAVPEHQTVSRCDWSHQAFRIFAPP